MKIFSLCSESRLIAIENKEHEPEDLFHSMNEALIRASKLHVSMRTEEAISVNSIAATVVGIDVAARFSENGPCVHSLYNFQRLFVSISRRSILVTSSPFGRSSFPLFTSLPLTYI